MSVSDIQKLKKDGYAQSMVTLHSKMRESVQQCVKEFLEERDDLTPDLALVEMTKKVDGLSENKILKDMFIVEYVSLFTHLCDV